MGAAKWRAALSCPGSETTVWRRRQKHELGRPCAPPARDTDGQPEKRDFKGTGLIVRNVTLFSLANSTHYLVVRTALLTA